MHAPNNNVMEIASMPKGRVYYLFGANCIYTIYLG